VRARAASTPMLVDLCEHFTGPGSICRSRRGCKHWRVDVGRIGASSRGAPCVGRGYGRVWKTGSAGGRPKATTQGAEAVNRRRHVGEKRREFEERIWESKVRSPRVVVFRGGEERKEKFGWSEASSPPRSCVAPLPNPLISWFDPKNGPTGGALLEAQ
jgi:hypothetical protein